MLHCGVSLCIAEGLHVEPQQQSVHSSDEDLNALECQQLDTLSKDAPDGLVLARMQGAQEGGARTRGERGRMEPGQRGPVSLQSRLGRARLQGDGRQWPPKLLLLTRGLSMVGK